VQKGKNINISKEYLLLFSHKLYSCLFSLLERDKAENTEITLVSSALFPCWRYCRTTNCLFHVQVPKTHTSFKEEQECKTVTDKQCKKVEKTVCH
jgi:hypothetical protein